MAIIELSGHVDLCSPLIRKPIPRRVLLTDKKRARGLRTEIYDNGWSSHFACLTMKGYALDRFLVEEMDFEMWDIWRNKDSRFTHLNKEYLPRDVDVFFITGVLYRFDVEEWKSFLSMYPNAKVVMIPLIDFRHWDSIDPWLIDRVDLILDWQKHNYNESSWFETVFPQHAYKHKFFPHCVTPYDNWMSVEYNEKPLQKALFSGRVGDRYLIRNAFLKAVLEDKELDAVTDLCYDARAISIADFSKHCSKHYWELDFINKEMVIKDDYIDLLSQYLCGVTCSTNRNHLLGKMFEIPASGSLLVCDDFEDLRLAGFEPGVHYVEVTERNVGKVVKEICQYPKDFEHIRRAGYDFVRENHNIRVRQEQLRKHIEGVLDE